MTYQLLFSILPLKILWTESCYLKSASSKHGNQNVFQCLSLKLESFYSAHDSFKMCVIEETKECPCDQEWCSDNTQTASHFAKTIMDNSLGFLLKQCNSIV